MYIAGNGLSVRFNLTNIKKSLSTTINTTIIINTQRHGRSGFFFVSRWRSHQKAKGIYHPNKKHHSSFSRRARNVYLPFVSTAGSGQESTAPAEDDQTHSWKNNIEELLSRLQLCDACGSSIGPQYVQYKLT